MDRPAIQLDVQSRLPVTIKMFSAELDRVKLVYDAQMQTRASNPNGVPVQRNFPSVAGQVKWARELCARISRPYNMFCQPEQQ